MNRKNATLQALFTSVLSLLLCVSMLVGTTFAWFTDSVDSGMNTIAAGNLDIELLANGEKVDTNTKLFADVELWEPGVVVYENLQVANVGTLALKYQMTLNFGGENNLNGHKLSEVLQIAIVNKIADNATRQEVLAAAKASENKGTLENFYLTGALEAGATAAEQTVVIFWEPGDNDNDYNANNGQTTSDGQPLHIKFGITLVATQLMSESDSFGNDYDEFASILPKAKVYDLGAGTKSATLNEWGSNKEAKEYDVPFVLQFQPNETLEDAMSSAYKYWHADYVVTADRDIPGNSMVLMGYYAAVCKDYNNDNWVALSSEDTIAAGTKIRLVDVMGGGDGTGNGDIKVTYKDICQWGNDGIGFLCTAVDLTGANAGTTLTVELRMFANESDPSDSSYNGGDETGESYLIGTYTYTFPAAQASNEAELNDALALGAKDIKVAAGTYSFPANKLTADTTLYCEEGTVFEGTSSLNVNGATVIGATFDAGDKDTSASGTINGIFKDCTFTGGSEGVRWCYTNAGETVVFENCVFEATLRGIHFDEMNGDVKFINCEINGFNAYGGNGTATFEGCTFGNDQSNYNGLNIYANTVLTNCTFNYVSGKTNFIDMEGTGKTLTITNCTATLDGVAADIADFVGGSKLTENTVIYN